MTKVRIVSGGYGAHENGRVKLYLRGQEAEVSQEEAERLVKLGVAEFVKEPVLMAETLPVDDAVHETGDTPEADGNDATDDLIPGHLDGDELRKLPFEKLKKLSATVSGTAAVLQSR